MMSEQIKTELLTSIQTVIERITSAFHGRPDLHQNQELSIAIAETHRALGAVISGASEINYLLGAMKNLDKVMPLDTVNLPNSLTVSGALKEKIIKLEEAINILPEQSFEPKKRATVTAIEEDTGRTP